MDPIVPCIATPGITPVKLTKEPLGTEGEMTPGPDDWNPFDDEQDRKEIEAMGFDPDKVMDRRNAKRVDPFVEMMKDG